MTDEAILTLVTNPETREEGFRHLVVRYQERLYQSIRSRVSSHEDADDVLQNTFVKVFRHINRFEGRSGLYTWIYRIAMNEVNNHHKRAKRMQFESLEKAEIHPADSFMDADDLPLTLEKHIDALPERQQLVFRMRYYDELTYREIAQILDLTEGALKASFHHAVRKIEMALMTNQIV